jgi:hypothetical protein
MTDSDGGVEQHINEMKEEYVELDAWASKVPGKFIVRCPACETPMHLGEGWRGCHIPECPDCNDTADEWVDDPRVSDEQAHELLADERQFKELILP